MDSLTSMLPTPPPSPQPRGFGAGLVIGLLSAIIVGLLVYIAARPSGGVDASYVRSPRTSPISTPIASQTPRPKPAAAIVTGDFAGQEWVEGESIALGVSDRQSSDGDCRVHAYVVDGRSRGAFYSDCDTWANDGYDLLFFSVVVRNRTDQPINFNLRNFVLKARDTRTFGPVNVRSKAKFPGNFLPEKGRVPPRSNIGGFLTFDGRVTGLVPASLSYIHRGQTITVVFEGRHVTT
jgi:hypothetical protein